MTTTVCVFIAGALFGYVMRAGWCEATISDREEARLDALRGRRR